MSNRQTIAISEEKTNANLEILDREFAAQHDTLRIFQRSGEVVQVRDMPERAKLDGKEETVWTPQIVRADKEHIQQAANDTLDFVKFDARSNSWRPASCRDELARLYIKKRTEWRLPVLSAIIDHPTLRADGSILDTPGFDERSGILFGPKDDFPRIPRAPTVREVDFALMKLLHPVRGFEFEDDCARAVWLACVLTALLRPSLPRAPIFGFDAPMAGSGKSKLAAGASIIAQGFECAGMSQAATAEEEEKRLFAALYRGAPFIYIDNCTEPLKSAHLCQISTAPAWSSRVLGKSEQISVPTSATVMATGNGLRFTGDLTTRALTCRLTPQTDKPERRQFDFDFEGECRRLRPALVVAALTIARGYVAGSGARVEAKSRFPEWDGLVRQPLIAAGLPDVIETMQQSQEEDDERLAFGRLMEAWRSAFGDDAKRVKEVAARVEESNDSFSPDARAELSEALAAVAPSKLNARTFDSERLGKYLRQNRDRYHDGLVLKGESDANNGAKWSVVRAHG